MFAGKLCTYARVKTKGKTFEGVSWNQGGRPSSHWETVT